MRLMVVGITCVAAASLGAGVSLGASQSTQTGDGDVAGPASHVAYARLFATVDPADPGGFGTNLEGAAFNSKGQLYFVDTTAPTGQRMLMSLDLHTRKVTDLYHNGPHADSMLNCIGFAPDGTMYVCDIKDQRIASYDPATGQLTDVLTQVDGTSFVPDDITLDPQGDMYIADYQGTPTDPTGRILVREANGASAVALTGLSHPNGIVFAPDHSAVWIDEDLSGTLDHVAPQPSSPAATTEPVTLHTASYLSLGTNAYTDSLTVDGAGNVYMAVYGGAEVLEFNSDGIQVGRVVFPGSAPKVTHVAIQPGTRDAYATASGPDGGYIYTFQALAAAPANTPNGG